MQPFALRGKLGTPRRDHYNCYIIDVYRYLELAFRTQFHDLAGLSSFLERSSTP
jgi:hypothetical protein